MSLARKLRFNSARPENIPTVYGVRNTKGIFDQEIRIKKHTHRDVWWKAVWDQRPYFGVQKHVSALPRVLLDRDFTSRALWSKEKNLPDEARWERVINGMRWSEDRVHYVEDDGQMHAVNWKLYSDRLNAELQQTVDQLPSYVMEFKTVPTGWKYFDVRLQWVKGLSVREAQAQCIVAGGKKNDIVKYLLERVMQGAENKGLDKEKLRIHIARVNPGETDKQVDMKSMGYYAWKTKRSSTVILGVIEDPEMVLPDRTVVPFATQLNLRRAGISTEMTVLDVPAITADGI